jgi:Spy/CpxP family protein refolding chaperone
MSFSKLTIAAFAASLLATAAYADSTPAAPPPGGGMMMGGHGGMMRGMFTPEERMMLFADAAKATAGMTDDQKHAYRHQQREHFMSMSDSDRTAMKADLDKRWAALTPEQQADIKTKVQAFMAARGMGGGMGGGGMGSGGGQ